MCHLCRLLPLFLTFQSPLSGSRCGRAEGGSELMTNMESGLHQVNREIE